MAKGVSPPSGCEAGPMSTEQSTGTDEGRRRHYGVFYGIDPLPGADEPGARPLLAVLGNCQAESLRITTTTTADGTSPVDSVRVPPVHELEASDIPHLHRLLPHLDVLAAQPVRDDYRGLPLGTSQVRAHLRDDARLVALPVLRDPSAYPFQALVRGAAGDPPVVPYHDLRTLAQAADLTGGPQTLAADELAEAYRTIAREGLAELARRQSVSSTLRADDVVAETLGEGWTINHPGNTVLVALGERLREAIGLPAPGADPGRVLLRSVRTPLREDVVEALDLPHEPRADWLVGGEVVADDEIRETQARWYAEHPEMVSAGVERHGERMRLLGWR